MLAPHARDRLAPTIIELVDLGHSLLYFEPPFGTPKRGNLAKRIVQPYLQTCQISRAQGRGFNDFRAFHRRLQNIGETAADEVVCDHAAVDTQLPWRRCIVADGIDQIAGLVAGGLECGAYDLLDTGVAR